MSAGLREKAEQALRAAFGVSADASVRAPGRVNLIGEHTDYNNGFVLPCAIGPEVRIAVRSRTDSRVRVVACDFAMETDDFDVGRAITPSGLPGWRDYVRGMVAQMAAAGVVTGGADLAIAGNLPRGAGLSSSAALEVAVGFALHSRGGLPVDAKAIALLAQRAENEFVGMRCGNMDQLASAASVEGCALLIDCASLELTPVPLPDGVSLMIIHSGVSRGLVEGRYNRRRDDCEAAAGMLGVATLREATLLDVDRLEGRLHRRARHIVTENARVVAAADALRTGDLISLGRLMRDSHASMRDDFEITVPPVDALALIASNAIGAAGGARMTGGGFGGAVVAMMAADAVERVRSAIVERYHTPDGSEPVIMVEQAAAGASTEWTREPVPPTAME